LPLLLELTTICNSEAMVLCSLICTDLLSAPQMSENEGKGAL